MIVRRKHLYYHRILRLPSLDEPADLRQLDDDEPVQPVLAVRQAGPGPPPLAVAGAVESDGEEGGGRLLRLLVLQLGQLELPDLQLVSFLPGLELLLLLYLYYIYVQRRPTLKMFSNQSLITSFSDFATLKRTLEVEAAALFWPR